MPASHSRAAGVAMEIIPTKNPPIAIRAAHLMELGDAVLALE